MRNVRNWLQVLLGVAFAAFALPLLAATKQFYAEFPSVLPTGNAQTITVKIVNVSAPPGVSTINSMQIDAPTGVTIKGVTGATISPSGGANTVVITNIAGIKRGETRLLQVVVDNNVTGCTSGSWAIQANSGNAFPQGDSFADLSTTAQLTSSLGCDVTLACSVGSYTEGTTKITRDLDNPEKNEGPCNPVGFSVVFSNFDRLVLIQWDESVSPEVVLKSETNWPAEELTATYWPKRTQVAWLLNTSSQPALIDAPACLSNSQPGVVGMDEVFPTLTGLSAPYEPSERARACIYSESFEVQPVSGCGSLPAPFGCIKVITKMWISGDPYLSRQ